MAVPTPTPILRFLHIDNLAVVLQRGGLHAPNHTPEDGLVYRTIHNTEIQQERAIRKVAVGPRGVIHDYVSFYFGPLSPMLLQLKTGRVAGYTEGQEPLVYLATTVQAVSQSGAGFVFTDGHGIAAFTSWFSDLVDLDKVDWDVVYLQYWKDTIEDMDRQRRKQAEFLVHQFCDWSLIQQICVLNTNMKTRVEHIVGQFDTGLCRPVIVRPQWYY
jgi:hypothetical protein